MKEKMKRIMVIGGVMLCCIGLVAGIFAVLQKDGKETDDTMPAKGEEIVQVQTIELEEPEIEKEEIIEPEIKDAEPQEVEATVKPEAIVVEETIEKETQQDIQEEVIEEPVVEAPELPETEATDNPDQKPSYEETPTYESSSQPQHGDTKDGKIYIMGFGWVEDEGGGTIIIEAPDMYENGNKVGIM